jgi:cobalt/nickel transport protein
MPEEISSQARSGGSKTWLLIAAVIVLAALPLFLKPGSEFGGADDQAEQVIAEIDPDARPWFEPIWQPPGGEIESLLFALQAALGAGLIGYYFGLKRGEHRARQQS